MENKKIQELKDDAEADKAIEAVKSSLITILKSISNKKDFALVAEAIMNFFISKKPILNSITKDNNYNLVLRHLNKMQSDLNDTNNKPVEKSVAQKS
jgi:hypothetical protein